MYMEDFVKGLCLVLVGILLVGCFIDIVEPNGWGFFGKVGAGNVAVVTHFGKIKEETLDSGFHFKSYFDTLNPMSTRTQTRTVDLAAFSRLLSTHLFLFSLRISSSVDSTVYKCVLTHLLF